jgi:hypothetical protein
MQEHTESHPHEEIEVFVTYAGAPPHHQYKHRYRRDATIGEVKAAALEFYGLKPGDDGQGNQIVFYLYREHERLNDDQHVGKLSHEHHLKVRLVREVVAG